MTLKHIGCLGMIAAAVLTGCGQKEPAVASAPKLSESVITAESPEPAGAGTVSGVVRFTAEVPEPQKISVQGNPECAALHPDGTIASEELLVKNGLVQNAIVYVKEGLGTRAFTPPASPAVVDNSKCAYVPHVIAVQVNQPVQLSNSDATLHNIHSYSKENKGFNLGLPFAGMKQIKKFDAPELPVMLKCDVHPWMKGYIGVFSHPYFFVTGEDGAFELKNVPAGEYVIEVWHEKLGIRSQNIRIEPLGVQEIEFVYGG